LAVVDQTGEPALSSRRGLSRDTAVPRRTPLSWARGGGLTTLLFLLPLLFVFGAFSWYPIVRTVLMSLQHTNLVQPATWVGFRNFEQVWHDPLFPVAVKNTAYFAGLAVLLWKVFYDASSTGAFNTVLGWIHLGPYPWLQSQQWAMPSLVLESTWANAGATVIIYLAALTGVQTELYEAASVDGAGIMRKVWNVTLPQLRGVLLVTMILQIIGTAQVFLEPYLFTSGGPANATLTVLLMIFNYAFGNSLGGDYGAATALSLMLAGFLGVFSLVYLRATRSWSTR
jgi:multiple sugar transport system permease protein